MKKLLFTGLIMISLAVVGVEKAPTELDKVSFLSAIKDKYIQAANYVSAKYAQKQVLTYLKGKKTPHGIKLADLPAINYSALKHLSDYDFKELIVKAVSFDQRDKGCYACMRRMQAAENNIYELLMQINQHRSIFGIINEIYFFPEINIFSSDAYEKFEKQVIAYKEHNDPYITLFKEKQNYVRDRENQVKRGALPAEVLREHKNNIFIECFQMRWDYFCFYGSGVLEAKQRCFYSLENLDYLRKYKKDVEKAITSISPEKKAEQK